MNDRSKHAGQTPGLRSHPGYWKVVQGVRALVTFPLVAAGFVAAVDLLGGRQDTLADRLATVVIGTCIASAATSLIFTLLSLQRLRHQLGGTTDLWVTEELEQFLKDVVNLRARKPGT